MEKPLLPLLPSALKGEKPIALTEGLLPSDLLHLKASVLGRPKSTVLPVLGYCLCLDAQGQPYALRAYVLLCPEGPPPTAAARPPAFWSPASRSAGWGACSMVEFNGHSLVTYPLVAQYVALAHPKVRKPSKRLGAGLVDKSAGSGLNFEHC